jgi:hypothetical protein
MTSKGFKGLVEVNKSVLVFCCSNFLTLISALLIHLPKLIHLGNLIPYRAIRKNSNLLSGAISFDRPKLVIFFWVFSISTW